MKRVATIALITLLPAMFYLIRRHLRQAGTPATWRDWRLQQHYSRHQRQVYTDI